METTSYESSYTFKQFIWKINYYSKDWFRQESLIDAKSTGEIWMRNTVFAWSSVPPYITYESESAF